MKGGRVSLSERKVAKLMELSCQRKEGDTNYANNQVWSHLEGRLLEQIRPIWIIAGEKLIFSADIISEQCSQSDHH